MNNQFSSENSVFTDNDFSQGFGLDNHFEQNHDGSLNFGMNNNALDMGLINEESFMDVNFPFDGLTQSDMGHPVDTNSLGESCR